MGLSNQHLGLIIIGAGVLLVLAGLLIWSGGFSWFGQLPGDIHIERDQVNIYIPIASMILLSLLLTLIANLVKKIF